ncbi:MAG TPA: alpha-ribazole kinase [Bacillota bacterium]|nr:alpha-ribazole kinase [Bacillota bacterium]
MEVVLIDSEKYLVAACDSCGGSGAKELDPVQVAPYITGRFTARVALLELVTTAAKPVMLTVTVASDPEPTGAGILQGVRDELKALDMEQLPLAVSTEKNIPTRQTGLGITAIGVCPREKLRVAATLPGDHLYCLGMPKVGSEIADPEDADMVSWQAVYDLLRSDGVHDIIPVGSRGIMGEVQLLAAQTGCLFQPLPEVTVDLHKSGGPSTCLIFSCSPPYQPRGFAPTPLYKLGILEKLEEE